jgi:hypothetical protein
MSMNKRIGNSKSDKISDKSSAFDTLDDGWEEAILFVSHVELEIEEEEP